MGLIEDELSEVRKLCEHVVEGCKLVSCVQSMIRAEIRRTNFKKIVVCIQYPKNYPNSPLIIELKSKTFSEKLLAGLTTVAEQEAKKYLGKPQVLKLIQFLRRFIDENPLVCCFDEINNLKKCLNDGQDEIKLKQKTSSINLKVVNRSYFLTSKIEIPDTYPDAAILFSEINSNFPTTFNRHIEAQAKEIARKCVEPPLRKPKPNEPQFKPAPSLEKSVSFLIDCIKRLPTESCQLCKQKCFPDDLKLLIVDENAPDHIERVYCGHLYHQSCLFQYLKAPPFGNKKCQGCNKKVCHPKWTLSDKLAEDRWAHEQARERELAEVEEFFK